MDYSEIINPKKTAARRMEEVEGNVSVPPAPVGQMSQSQFMKARTPEERMKQQQALAQKLRSLGQ